MDRVSSVGKYKMLEESQITRQKFFGRKDGDLLRQSLRDFNEDMIV